MPLLSFIRNGPSWSFIVGSTAGTASIPSGAGVHLWVSWSVAESTTWKTLVRSTTTTTIIASSSTTVLIISNKLIFCTTNRSLIQHLLEIIPGERIDNVERSDHGAGWQIVHEGWLRADGACRKASTCYMLTEDCTTLSTRDGTIKVSRASLWRDRLRAD